jgi:hypothetical protein
MSLPNIPIHLTDIPLLIVLMAPVGFGIHFLFKPSSPLRLFLLMISIIGAFFLTPFATMQGSLWMEKVFGL